MGDKVEFTSGLCADLACSIFWLDHWQTLVGAAIAIPFAAFAIVVPIIQERRRIQRRAFALRASLPLRLSEIVDYATQAIIALGACRTNDGVHDGMMKAFKSPRLAEALVGGLEQTMEALNNWRVNRRLASIIEQIQVLNARMSGIPTENQDGAWIDQLLVQAGTIYAQAESLYDYGRRRSNTTPRRILWSDVAKALHIAKLFDLAYPDVYATLQRYDQAHLDPEIDARLTPSISRHVSLWVRRLPTLFEQKMRAAMKMGQSK